MDNFLIRPATPDDDERLIEIHNAVHHDRLPVSVADYRRWQGSPDSNAFLERYVVEIDDKVVADLDMREEWHTRRKDALRIFLQVDEPHRCRGIGSRLHRLLEERAQGNRIRRIYVDVRGDMPESLAFAERRGFHPTGRKDQISTLDVHNARLDRFLEAEERVLRSGITIATLEEIGMNEPFLRSILSLENETAYDIPSSEERADRDFAEWQTMVLEADDMSPAWIWLALDAGRPVGIARLRSRGPQAMVNGMTAVARSHRGRGIARALKLQTVRWARQNGIDRIDTGNDAENHPMLAINRELGYQPLPAEIELLQELG